MMNEPQNLPIPTFRFSPYILHKASVFQSRPTNFQKRHYKHVHHLTLKPKSKFFLKRVPMPKTLLHTLNLSSWKLGQNLCFVKKLVKPYKEYLRHTQGAAIDHPKIKKLLSLLTNLKLDLTRGSFRMLTFHPNVKKLRVHIPTEYFSKEIIGEKFIRKSKISLSRNLAKIKNLTTLSMDIASQEVWSAVPMLEIIDRNIPLGSLKEFALKIYFDQGLGNFREQKANIGRILTKLTHLETESASWYSFLISSGKLINLSVLRLQLYQEQREMVLKDLLCFHDFQKIRKFSLKFHADSLSLEKSFFENFSLPSSLEKLTLTLTGFTRSLTNLTQSSETQFLKRLQKAKGVKVLRFKLTKTTGKLACLLVRCFESLENLEVLNYKDPKEKGFHFRRVDAQTEPLDFQDIWIAATSSKEALKSISLSVSKVNFPEKANALETGFPRLQKLCLGESVSSATELARFCHQVSSLRDVTLKGVKLPDEVNLGIFLDVMKETPEGVNFELHFDAGNIRQNPLIGCLKRYIEVVKVKGQLRVQLIKVQVEDLQAFGEILKLVVEKGCFESFKMETRIRSLFSVAKTKVIETASGLTSK